MTNILTIDMKNYSNANNSQLTKAMHLCYQNKK